MIHLRWMILGMLVLSLGATTQFAVAQDVSERRDIHHYLTVDSVRGRILYADGVSKTRVMGLDSWEGTSMLLHDLQAMDSTWDGTLEYLKVMPSGKYLLYEYRTEACDRMWLLSPEEGRLQLVFTFRNIYQSLKYNWGVEEDTDRGILYLSEYGVGGDPYENPKKLDNWMGDKGDATRIWMSEDEGETWRVFYDFHRQKGIQVKHFHIHGLHYDPWDQRLWVTTGDGWVKNGKSNKRLWWFEAGDSVPHNRDWRYYWGESNDAYSHGQIISLYADRDFLVAGGDDYNNCLYRINKADKAQKMYLETTYHYDTEVEGLVTQYTSRFRRLSNGMIVTMLIAGDGNGYPQQTRLVGTRDGYTWNVIYRGVKVTEPNGLWNTGLWDEWQGYIYFCLHEQVAGETVSRLIRLPLTLTDNPEGEEWYAPTLPIKYYDVTGRRMSAPTHGLYIERRVDGRVVKIQRP